MEQSYQQLEQDSQEQQTKLLENLEKSYDAYSEKCSEVEVLERKLKEFTESKKESEQDNSEALNAENKNVSGKVKNSENIFSKKLVEEAVENVLTEAGLSHIKTDKVVKLNLLDLKKLEGLFGGKYHIVAHSVTNKVNDLEQSNDFLKQAISSLKEHSENQGREIAKSHEMLQEKTDECLNLQKEVKRMKTITKKKNKPDVSTQKNAMKQDILKTGAMATGLPGKGSVIIERQVLARIVVGLSEMYDFTSDLKKTILDQNSWIDMLMDAMNEYRKTMSRKGGHQGADHGNAQSRVNSKEKSFDSFSSAATIVHDGGSITSNVTTDQSNLHGIAQNRNFSGTVGIAKHGPQYPCDGSRSRDVDDESDGGFIVLSKLGMEHSSERLAFEHHKVRRSSDEYSSLPTLSPPSRFTSQDKTHDRNPKRLEREMHPAANTGTSANNGKILKSFPGDSRQTSVFLDKEKPGKQVKRPQDDMCPLCEVIFDVKADVAQRRRHINEHFTN